MVACGSFELQKCRVSFINQMEVQYKPKNKHNPKNEEIVANLSLGHTISDLDLCI
jgi:hypothetical protein